MSTATDYISQIDTSFPTPGVDNDTTGFRNNFSAISNALITNTSDIVKLQAFQLTTENTLGSSSASTLTSLLVNGTITATNFIGDGSGLTNVTSIGTLTSLLVNGTITARNLSVTSNINVGVAVISTTNNYLNISGVTQLYFADHKFSVVPKKYDNGTLNQASITLDYNLGKYQTLTLDATSLSGTTISVTNWPTTGNFAQILIEVLISGISTITPNTEFRNSCTTYGSTSTTVSIDDWVGSTYNGTTNLHRGYGVYDTPTITSSTQALTYVDSIVNNKTITVFPGYSFVKGTTYYFAPQSSTNLPYKLTLIPSTIKTEQNLNLENLFSIGERAVYHLYSYNNGSTIFFNKLDIYPN